jgi:hypothetical protein
LKDSSYIFAKCMKPGIIFLILLLAALVSPRLSAVPIGAAFTYQGHLTDSGNAAQGKYDLRFALYDDAVAGTLVAGPLTNTAVVVSNGLFTATLDFGSAFDGLIKYLEVSVRPVGSGPFVGLTPRQAVTPTPTALYAPTAGSAAQVDFRETKKRTRI